jgi:DNA invertase Pin-like site-specific DNA recombinase
MLVGYARVSTLDQNPQLQIDALKQAGCQSALNIDPLSASKIDPPRGGLCR